MNRRGFTLIELLIVLSVLAILAGAVVSSAGRPATQALEATARVLASDLRLARSLAVQHGSEWTVRFDFDGRGYELLHTGTGNPPPPRNPLAPPRSDGRYRVDFASDAGPARGMVRIAAVQLATSGQAASDVRFQPLGGTGPARSEDTLIRLVAENGPSAPAVLVTVSWVTGNVWVAPIDQPGKKID
ncbi:MAG: GspH/FimT family pseudopilin [Planctomycetales bacterium]